MYLFFSFRVQSVSTVRERGSSRLLVLLKSGFQVLGTVKKVIIRLTYVAPCAILLDNCCLDSVSAISISLYLSLILLSICGKVAKKDYVPPPTPYTSEES